MSQDTCLYARVHVCVITSITDMINMFRLSYQPSLCEWIYSGGGATPAIAW